jgi:hypothetical protein
MIFFTNSADRFLVQWTFSFRVLIYALRAKDRQGYFCFSCFFLICRVSICEAKELSISVLKSSSRLPISALVAPPLADFWTLENVVSLLIYLFLAAPLEHLLHKLTISSYDSLDMSPFPSMFSISRESSLTPFNKMVLRISLPTSG